MGGCAASLVASMFWLHRISRKATLKATQWINITFSLICSVSQLETSLRAITQLNGELTPRVPLRRPHHSSSGRTSYLVVYVGRKIRHLPGRRFSPGPRWKSSFAPARERAWEHRDRAARLLSCDGTREARSPGETSDTSASADLLHPPQSRCLRNGEMLLWRPRCIMGRCYAKWLLAKIVYVGAMIHSVRK